MSRRGISISWLALLIAISFHPRLRAEAPATQPAKAAVTVTVDAHQAPELEEWGASAKAYAEKWYPEIAERLTSDDFTPPDHVTLVFSKQYKGVAATSGTTVTISDKWVKAHPDDLGMVAHEITHVIQHYPPSNGAGWLVEGLADYVRYYFVEPDSPRAAFNIDKSKWNSGYQASAGFLNYLERTYPAKRIVSTLNAALRKGEYKQEMFKELTGKEPDELWEDFKAQRREKQ